MISYKWINVMYLKMKRIKLLLNYLSLLMNIQASMERVFPFIFCLKIDCLLRKRKKKAQSPYQIRMKLKSSFIKLNLYSVNKYDPCFAWIALNILISAFNSRHFFHLNWDWNLSSDKNLRRFKLQFKHTVRMPGFCPSHSCEPPLDHQCF